LFWITASIIDTSLAIISATMRMAGLICVDEQTRQDYLLK